MEALDAPVGVFDSGIGGWSVLRELRRELPGEHLLYVADSACAPYGDRPAEFIVNRSRRIADWLVARGAKALVVACNTATAAAVAELRAHHALPIVAIEPAVKPAVRESRSRVVGVLATSQTLASEKYSKLVDAHGQDVTVLAQACPGLVERIEAGDLGGPETRALLSGFIAPLLAQGADTLVLACTHYPLLLQTLRELVGPGVALVDPAPAVARELNRRLSAGALLRQASTSGDVHAVTTGEANAFRRLLAALGEAAVPCAAIAV